MVGLESALRVVQLAMVDTGMLTWADVARVMSRTPARIGRLAGHGAALAAGEPASLTLYDPAPTRTFSKADLHGRSANSPYLGRELPGEVRWTLHGGVATVADGLLLDAPGVRA
jgi:dihydroorotase